MYFLLEESRGKYKALMEVAIFGAGVGGLTVAHKLATSGIPFQITVYELKSVAGGLARSEGPPCDTREISWRVYFDFYRHVPALMRQIPDGRGATVYDHMVPYQNLTLSSKKSVKDLIISAGQIARIVTASDARLNQWDSSTWYDAVGKYTRLDIPQWLGLDRYRASYMSVAKVGIEQFLLGRSGRDSVLDGPTNEVWIDPWVRYLRSLGVVFRFSSRLASVRTTGDTTEAFLETGEKVSADIHVLSVPIEALADVTSGVNAARLAARSRQIQLAFQLYLKTQLSFGSKGNNRPVLSVLLTHSPWALIIEAKALSWSVPCAPWSVTVCQADVPGPLTGKPLIRCTAEEAYKEVMSQMVNNEQFIDLLRRENRNFDGIHVVRWTTMADSYFFSETGMTTTEPKFSNNAGTKTLRPSFVVSPNIYIATAYVRETLDIFSMEAAAIAGHFVAARICGTDPPTLPSRPLKNLLAPIRLADEVLACRGGPHIGFICVWIILLVLVVILLRKKA